MKRVYARWGILLGMFCLAACSRQKETVVNFQLEGLTPGIDPVVVTENRITGLLPDSLGFAVFDPGEGQEYACFRYGNYRLFLYFPAGKGLTVYIDLNPATLGAEFRGAGALENEILNGKYLCPLNRDFRQNERSFVESLEKARQKRKRQLDSLQLDSVFVSLMEARTGCEIVGLLAVYPEEHRVRTDSGYRPSDSYTAYVRDCLLKERVPVGREECAEAWAEALKVAGGKFGNRPFTFRRLDRLLRFADTVIADTGMREAVTNRLLTDFVETTGTDSLERLENMYRQRVKDGERLAAFRNLCGSWKKLQPGAPAYPVRGYTRDSLIAATATEKGHYLYLLFWRTDCPVSVEEWTYLRQGSRRPGKENIRFVGIALGENRQTWEEFLDARGVREEQWYAVRKDSLLAAYKIKKLPHALLIGPQGEITDAAMRLPSDGRLAEELRALKVR